MKTKMVLIAGAMFASMTLAAGSGPAMEEQYRAKYGVYPPWYKAQVREEVTHGACCEKLKGQNVMAAAEQRSRTKYGYALPAAERKLAAERVELAAHQRACATMTQCNSMAAAPVAAAHSEREAQQVAKYGKALRVVKPAADTVGKAEVAEACEHACCQRGE